MKAVYLVLLTAIALTLPAGGVAESGTIHTGKGTILLVDSSRGWVLMTEEPRGTHLLSVTYHTQVVDELGNPISAIALQVGDLVREECLEGGDGKFLARQIRLLRPAWMETASPEL